MFANKNSRSGTIGKNDVVDRDEAEIRLPFLEAVGDDRTLLRGVVEEGEILPSVVLDDLAALFAVRQPRGQHCPNFRRDVVVSPRIRRWNAMTLEAEAPQFRRGLLLVGVVSGFRDRDRALTQNRCQDRLELERHSLPPWVE